ncbi:MAG TPA: hypothetical protein PKN59_03120 [Syntrophales bacterium]|nr:hypothetical protein [Syntrophales bacterium]
MKRRHFNEGVIEITERLNQAFPKAEGVVTEKQVRDAIHEGMIPTEPRSNDHEPYKIDVTSCDALAGMIGDPHVDKVQVKEASVYLEKSETHVKRLMQAGAPFKKIFGRVAFCTTSLDHFMGQRPTRNRKSITSVTDCTGGTNPEPGK